MNKKNATLNALFTSIISLLLCVSMLVGTTFAWFTDEVVTGMNTIAAGNLDVELLADGVKVESDTKLFDLGEDTWWEPGMVVYENLQVANVGTLALKYQMRLNIGSENDLNGRKLSEVLKVAILDQTIDAGTMTRTEVLELAQAAVATDPSNGVLSNFYLAGELEAGISGPAFAVVIFWAPNDNATDNLYNANNGQDTSDKQPLHIEFGVNLQAAQKMLEEDSFGFDYDADAAVFSVAEANAMMAQNKDTALVGCVDPNGVLVVPANFTGTLTLDNVTIASVQEESPVSTVAEDEDVTATAPTGTKIVILNNVVVKANQEGMSAISGKNLNITGNGRLTAVGKGDAAFGIGGMTTDSVNISGITIDYVEGGRAYGVGDDTKYYKDAPEGGAAIGSGMNGAVITLDNVTVTKAIGGSKAAAIGARYHTGVTVNITNSTIGYAEGGVSAAGIGGSRISNGAGEKGTTINISNSAVTAKGGAYGAGIGSGYDTHCQSSQPLCTINITGSTINATGGKYAAGVGTGYHHAALAGEIKNSTVNAASGEKWYKDTYTLAQDVGFGVTDPVREGQQTSSKLIINGVEFGIPNIPVKDAATLNEKLSAGESVVLGADIKDAPAENKAPYGNSYGIALNGGVLDGNGKVLDFDIGPKDSDGKYDNYGIMTSGGTIKNVTITGVFRGIMIMNPTEDLYIDNVTIGDEDVCYAINTGEGDGTHDLYVTNSTIKGWSSYGTAIKDLYFTNCTFAQGEYYTNVYGRLVKPYVDTVFENCEFSSKFYIDLSQLGKDGDGNVLTPDTKIILKNCTVNGVKLTAENWTQLIASENDCGEGQISIEAKDGSYMTASNVLDYVIIQ